MQRLQADAEDLGGARLVVARVFERHQDQPPLGFLDRRPRLERHRRLHHVGRIGDQRRQLLRLDELAVGQDDRAFDDVAHLAHVARPVVLLEDPHRRGIDCRNGLVVALVELGEERLDQQREVVLALAQRRQLDGEDVEAVVEILAQLAVLHGVRGIDVGRGNDADVDGLLLPSAKAAELPLLQHAQQLDLRGRRHLRNFVEKERPAVRELEASFASIGRAGERALLVAENLALEQRLGNRGAVDRHKRHLRARAELVDGLGHQLLAGARLAPDENDGLVGAACSIVW